MIYSEFLSQIKTMAKARAGSGASVTIRPVLKNNNLRLDGLLILYPGENISPAIYLNPYYARYLGGMSLEAILDDIFMVYEAHRLPARFNTDLFRDFSAVKDRLFIRLISRSANPGLLEEVPYVPFLDLAAVFCFSLEDDSMGSTTVLIRNNYADFWETDADALYRLALSNMRRRSAPELYPLSRLSGRQTGETILSSVFVLTNRTAVFGAASLLFDGFLASFAAKHGDFYVLPSSVHEVLLVPRRIGLSPISLLTMLREVNQKDIAPEDVLSDCLYLYREKEKRLGLLFLPEPKQFPDITKSRPAAEPLGLPRNGLSHRTGL